MIVRRLFLALLTVLIVSPLRADDWPQWLGPKGDGVWRETGLVGQFPKDEPDSYQVEWEDLMQAIRGNKPYNEVERGAQASLVTAMGRMAAHTGQEISYDQMLNFEHKFAPEVDKLTMDSDAPIQADQEGKYALPRPGIQTKREY